MSVRRKPNSTNNVNDFILAAGSEKEKESDKAIQPVKLRVPDDLLQQIDNAVSRRRPAPSRHQWILEAIYEKLDR
ncbi:hypothetical protein ABTF91_20355, partial [Acinetobacter baumannii]